MSIKPKLVLPSLLAASTLFAQGSFHNGQAARAVLGQLTFTKGDANGSAQILGGAGGVAYGNGRLYVADSNRPGNFPQNHRVLVFDTTKIPSAHRDITTDPDVSGQMTCYLCGFTATLTLGQDTFAAPSLVISGQTVIGFYPGQNGGQDVAGISTPEHAWFNNAVGVAVDPATGAFAVADTDNNRVLIWKQPPISNNQPPDLVLGQPDFATIQKQQTGVSSATAMRGPESVWLQNNKVYVADTQNFRVLIWNSFPASNNQAPDLVLGQPDFTHRNGPPPSSTNPATAANQLLNPTSVSVAPDGHHLFVSDLGFHRVLIWNNLPTVNGQGADVVVGQPDMTGSVSNNPTVCGSNPVGDTGQCVSSLSLPRFALSDGTRLFIADGGNDRVLIFNTIPTSNGASADVVLGQPGFTNDIITSGDISIISTAIDNTGAVDTLPTPTSLAWDGTNLYVADPTNRRVLVYTPGDVDLPSYADSSANFVPVVNWASEIVRQEGTVLVQLVSGGSITANDTVTISITPPGVTTANDYKYTIKTGDTIDGITRGLVRLINNTDTTVTALYAGNSTGTIYLSSIATGLDFDTIALSSTSSNTNNILTTASGAYLSAGNAATAAPGALVEVNAPNGVSFTSSPATVAPLVGPLPTTLAGVQLYLDGIAVPLMRASGKQIVGQVPFYFYDRNSTSVYVRSIHSDGSSTVTSATPVYISPASPGIFNAPAYPGQARPWPAAMAYHQAGNPTAVISVDGSVTAADTATITIGSASYTYTVAAADTLTTIVTGLINAINGSNGGAGDPSVVASQGAAFTRVVLTSKLAGAAGTGVAISTTTSASAAVTLTAYSNATCCDVQPGSLIYSGNPAVPGELISISASGLGLVVDINNQGIPLGTGGSYSGPVLNSVPINTFVSATMGGQTAQVIGAGFPQGSYGIYQVQMVVPTGLTASDSTQLYIAQNAFISNTVTLPVGNAIPNPPPPAVSAPASTISISVDVPADGATISGNTEVAGWAISDTNTIVGVSINVDGIPFGSAAYGVIRNDVCAVYPGRANCPSVGYDTLIDTTLLGNGGHVIRVVATDNNGAHLTMTRSVTVSNDPNASATHVFTDNPAANGSYHGTLYFAGWAVNNSSPIVQLRAAIDGAVNTAITYGGQRADVCAAYPGAGCPNVGWKYLVDLTKVANGPHTFSMTAIAANGQKYTVSTPFTVANYVASSLTNGSVISIDAPSASAGAVRGVIGVGGWAINATAPVSFLTMSVDGVDYGVIPYGGVRSDVCTAFSNPPGCPKVGWDTTLDTTLLADGTHTIAITAYPGSGQASTSTRTITVGNLSGASSSLRIQIDNPSSGATLSGPAAGLFGWTLSSKSAIQSVKISVDGVAVGTGTYGSVRADACAMFPGSPNCPNVGWGYSLNTLKLTNGSHMLEATVTTVTGERATASTLFQVQNSAGPGHVYIDLPSSAGRPYTGLATFSGWAVNDNAAIVSVAILIDGVPRGTAAYGSVRPDVCALYPGRAGCPNVGWSITLDTSGYTDGTHTFGVVATAADGTTGTSTSSLTVANYTAVNPLTVNIDTPASTIVYSGVIVIGGWTLDPQIRIGSVFVTVDGIPFGNAQIGVNRADACAIAGSPDCPNVGWDMFLDTSLLGIGTHTLGVTATTVFGQSSTVTRSFSTAN